ncbi:hypothetical protein [Gloeocapsopsis dulcis]|uniref:hypothetical protein n=1 Tax=Gloeocapsopsis dulcis TaxID=2859516 RepID=UPI0012DA9535|nr:hypothetical protein [Gloeocapsopsis dulcis]
MDDLQRWLTKHTSVDVTCRIISLFCGLHNFGGTSEKHKTGCSLHPFSTEGSRSD